MANIQERGRGRGGEGRGRAKGGGGGGRGGRIVVLPELVFYKSAVQIFNCFSDYGYCQYDPCIWEDGYICIEEVNDYSCKAGRKLFFSM